MDSEHANLIYRFENGKITVVDKRDGSYGLITPDVRRALDANKKKDSEGEGSMSVLKRFNPAFR